VRGSPGPAMVLSHALNRMLRLKNPLTGPVKGLLKTWFIRSNANAGAGCHEVGEGNVRARGSRSSYGSFPRLTEDAEAPKPCTVPVKGLLKTRFICSNDNARAGCHEGGEGTVRARRSRSSYGSSPRLAEDAETPKKCIGHVKRLLKAWFICSNATPGMVDMRETRELYARGGLGPPMVLSHTLQRMLKFQKPFTGSREGLLKSFRDFTKPLLPVPSQRKGTSK
jgi:hypothetical protein